MSVVVQYWNKVFVNRMKCYGVCFVLYIVIDVVVLVGNDLNILCLGLVVIKIVLICVFF